MPSLDEQRHGSRPVGVAVTAAVTDAVAEAVGQTRRIDPVLPGTGGPAGTPFSPHGPRSYYWLGSVAELLTLFNVNGMVSWHVAMGALLVLPALMKTTSTGWRIVRYYTGHNSYRQAGPPPVLMRLLGPLVVVSTLGLLGSGVLLVLLGPRRSHSSVLDVAGVGGDWVTVHHALFAVWAVVTGLHLLGRLVPALRITFQPRASVASRARHDGSRWPSWPRPAWYSQSRWSSGTEAGSPPTARTSTWRQQAIAGPP